MKSQGLFFPRTGAAHTYISFICNPFQLNWWMYAERIFLREDQKSCSAADCRGFYGNVIGNSQPVTL